MPLIDRLGVAGHVSKPGQGFHLEGSRSQGLAESVATPIDKLDVGVGVGDFIGPSISDVDDDTGCS